jgi:hypothetical protein
MGYKEFQLLVIFWRLGLVDTFSVLKLCVNCGSQYVSIVLSSAAGNYSDLGMTSLVEPILGFATSYQFVQAAATAAERHQRIATLASFLAASGGALTTDAAIGAAIASKIGYMKAILARGGSSQLQQCILTPSLKDFVIVADSIKTPVLESHAYRRQFTSNCKISIDTMLQEHTARRYFQGSVQKMIAPTSLAPIVSTQVSTTAFIGFTTLGVLYLFQRAERKRFQNQNEVVVIDVPIFKS